MVRNSTPRHGGRSLGAAHTMERFRTCFSRPSVNRSGAHEELDEYRRELGD